MTQTATTIKTTVQVTWTNAPLIRMSTNVDMPEYGLLADQTFYLSRSSKDNGDYYISTWDYNETCWMCRCPARKPCKHMHLINADCHKLAATRKAAKLERAARLAAHRQAEEAKAEAEVAEVLAQLDAEPETAFTVQQDGPTATQPVASVPTIAPTKISASTAIVAMKTPPQVRNVSLDWLLKGSRSGAFSGRVA